MNKKVLPWLMLMCALGLSTTAAYYSIIGLSIVFFYSLTQILKFYGVAEDAYGIYLLFFGGFLIFLWLWVDCVIYAFCFIRKFIR